MARILIIEDDEAVRAMLRLTLTLSQHTVFEAQNGEEGLTLFSKNKPDLLILDIVMPEKEGLEVLMDLKKKDPAVKVIAISGGGRRTATDYLKMAKLMGASQILEKPFSSEALMAAVEALLAGPKKS